MPRRNPPAPVQSPGADPSRRAWGIFAFCFLLGAAAAALFVQQGIRDYRVFHEYRPSQCTVTGKGVIVSTLDAGVGRLRRPLTTFATQYVFEHDVGGKHITAIGSDNMDGVMGDAATFDVGKAYPCWYDPADPSQAVLARRLYPVFYAVALIPLAFLVISGNFLVLALGPRRAIAIADGGQGQVLAVRLAPELSRTAALVAFAFIFIAWSAGLLAALAWTLQDATRLGDWWFFLLLAIGAEAWLVRFTLSAVKAMRIPDPVVEIDHEPVNRGDSLKVSVRQDGPARFDIFRVAVVCERQGQGGSGKESQKVLHMKKDLQVAEHSRFAEVLDAAIASDAAPSEKAVQSLTTWRVVVKRSKKGLWGLDREYVFRVV